MEFSLVMPCFKCEDTIKKAIDSILDQDFEDWELVCVVNGKWDKREETVKIIEGYAKKDKRIRLIQVDSGGACYARNVGAESSSGKYISFFSSDFYMYPGCLRKWKKELEAEPVDFVYSGYGLMKDGKMLDTYCPSEPFDPWRLGIENYIDGGFPMKREVWEKGRWDEKIVSLNDWDFWLTAVDNGFKGKYIADSTYAAEMPKKGGLSFDSHANWLERVSYIKKKHGIKESDICVVSLGAAPHGKRIAKLIGADFKFGPQMKPHKYKAIYLLGFYVGAGDSAIAHSNVFNTENAVHKDLKRMIHWIGTDILQLLGAAHKVCYADMKQLIDMLSKCENITEFEQTERELLSLGIESKVLALPIEADIKVLPLPRKFTVAIYAPNTPTAGQIYNLDFIKEVIKACPDIRFVLFGGGLKDFKADNVENLGWTDMQKVMEKSSCLMRIAYHDGMPVAPIEFRLAGRDAITTVQMKYIWFAGTGIIHEGNFADRKEKIIGLLRTVKKEQKKKGVQDIEKAREYYLRLTDPKEFKRRIEEIAHGKVAAPKAKRA